MTTRRPTARERIADWTLAYRVVLEEMERSVYVPARGDVNNTFTVSEQGRRTAALAAAILISSAGAERVAVAVAEEEGE